MASKQYLEGIGFSTGVDRVCPDLAFGLPRRMFSNHLTSGSKKTIIGVGLKDYYGPDGMDDPRDAKIYRDYLETMATFVYWLCERGYTVRVLIGDVTYDSSVILDFANLLERRGLAPGDGRIVSEPALTVDQLLAQIATTDLVISPRFHNLVLASMLNKPFLLYLPTRSWIR